MDIASQYSWPQLISQTPGRIQKVDRPTYGSISFVIYTMGVVESRIGGSTFWILPGVGVV